MAITYIFDPFIGNFTPINSGGGTVNSVGLSAPSIFTVSGSPVTNTGTLTFSLNTETTNAVFAGPPSGGSAVPTFRSLVSADIPNLASLYVTQSEVGTANGVASLDGSGKIPASQLPSTVLEYQGLWNPNTNTPTLQDSTGTNGYVYQVSAPFSGTIAGLNNATMTNFQTGNLVIYSSALGQWQQATAVAGVVSVNGAQGSVTVNAINQLTGDVTAGPASQSQSETSTVAKIQGTTVSGTTGSGNVVFSVSPTLTGTITAASANFSGAISSSNFSGSSSGTNTGDQTITLTGDVTGSGTGAFATTLATVNSNVGSFTYSNITVNAKGLITAASNGSTTGFANSTLSNLTSPTAVNQNLIPGNITTNLGASGTAWDILFVKTIEHQTTGGPKIDVLNGQLDSSNGAVSVDWNSRVLQDDAGNISVDYQDYALNDPAGATSVDFGNRLLGDNNGMNSVDWQNRLLIDSAGATQLAWSTTGIQIPVGGSAGYVFTSDPSGNGTWQAPATSGTVTNVSVASANGFAGTVATSSTTPVITVKTTITGLLKGNGTAISAATPGTDYVIPSGSITGTASNITATTNSTLTTLSALSLPGTQVIGNISGNAANVTGTVVVANGGTGDTSFTANQVILGGTTSTGALTQVAGGTTGQVLTAVSATAAPTWQTPSVPTLSSLGIRAGNTSISSAATSQAVTFSSTLGSASYGVSCTLVNTTDSNPQMQPITIIAQSATGFTALWSDPTLTANYVLSWTAILNT